MHVSICEDYGCSIAIPCPANIFGSTVRVSLATALDRRSLAMRDAMRRSPAGDATAVYAVTYAYSSYYYSCTAAIDSCSRSAATLASSETRMCMRTAGGRNF